MTAPRWIAEALDSLHHPHDMLPDGIESAANALIERLPLEAMATAVCARINGLPEPGPNWTALTTDLVVLSCVTVLTDGDPEVVELTEIYQNACRALDEAGVPYAIDVEAPASIVIESTIGELAPHKPAEVRHVPAHPGSLQMGLPDRIRWLASERPIRAELESAQATCKLAEETASKYMAERDTARRERDSSDQRAAALTQTMEAADRLAETRGSELQRVEAERSAALSEVHALGEFLRAAHEELTTAGVAQSPTDSQHMLDSALARRVRALRDERDHVQKMYEGASDDLDRERSARQDAEAAASNREIALTANLESANERERQRDAVILALIEGDFPAGDLRHALAELIGMGAGSADTRAAVAATDRQVLRAKVDDQAGYIEQLELEIEALEDQIDSIDRDPNLPNCWTGCEVGAP